MKKRGEKEEKGKKERKEKESLKLVKKLLPKSYTI